MKILILSILFTVSSTYSYSQQLIPEVFIGTWKVIDSQLRPEFEMGLDVEGKQKLETLRIGFVGTIFGFKKNNEFTITFPTSMPDMMKELEFVNNQKWKIDKEQMIAIGSKEDGYSLMVVNILNKKEKMYFIIFESPFIFEMSKF